MNELIHRIEELFTKELQEKTGWGRNEILWAYKRAVRLALIEESNNDLESNTSDKSNSETKPLF